VRSVTEPATVQFILCHGDDVRDPMMLAELIRREVDASGSEGFGDLSIEGNTLVVWWRGGTLPPGVRGLLDGSDARVIVRSCRYTERELRDAVQSLVDGWHRLPFTMVSVGPLPGAAGVRVEVAELELPQAQSYFTEQPLRPSPDGVPIEVHIEPTGYPPVVIHSLRARTVEELARVDVDRYVGLHIDEATRRALEDGWLVRSFAEDAGGGLTLDLRRDRLDLCHNRQGTVIRADVG
jgi:hypothetical protein